MVLQPKIPLLGAPQIANYDFTDLVSGLGFQDFFLIQEKTGDAGTTAYVLTTNSAQNSALGEVGLGSGTEVNFDSSTFNLPRTIKGFMEISGGIQGIGTGNTAQFQFRLLKVDADNNETEIIAAVKTHRATAVGYFFIQAECTETIIEIGDKIRLEVIGDEASNTSYLGTSPTDQDGATGLTPSSEDTTTITRVSVPFRIYT